MGEWASWREFRVFTETLPRHWVRWVGYREMDTIPERFSRAAGQAPRATVAAYAMAVLSAAVALTVGLIGGTAYTIAIGVGAAIGSAITWAVIGTIVALLAQIADNRR